MFRKFNVRLALALAIGFAMALAGPAWAASDSTAHRDSRSLSGFYNEKSSNYVTLSSPGNAEKKEKCLAFNSKFEDGGWVEILNPYWDSGAGECRSACPVSSTAKKGDEVACQQKGEQYYWNSTSCACESLDKLAAHVDSNSSRITANEGKIASNSSKISENSSAITKLGGRISTAETNIAFAKKTADNALSTANTAQSDFSGLQTQVNTNTQNIKTNTTNISILREEIKNIDTSGGDGNCADFDGLTINAGIPSSPKVGSKYNFGNKNQVIAGNAAITSDSNKASNVTWVYVGNKMYIADSAITSTYWNSLNNKGLIFGKNVTIDGKSGKIRSLTCGASGAATAKGQTEWDDYVVNLSGSHLPEIGCGVHMTFWGWGTATWCQETSTGHANHRVFRGGSSATAWGYDIYGNYGVSNDNSHGFRPVFVAQ